MSVARKYNQYLDLYRELYKRGYLIPKSEFNLIQVDGFIDIELKEDEVKYLSKKFSLYFTITTKRIELI